MSIPIIYNIRSVRVRWVSTAVAVFGIAGVVSVFIAMLAMAQGFQSTLVASGSPYNAIIRRGGATSEMDSALTTSRSASPPMPPMSCAARAGSRW